MKYRSVALNLDISNEYDGMVLTDQGLVAPDRVSEAARYKFLHCDGIAPRPLIKRYSANYPDPDATTPTFRQFRLLGGTKLKRTEMRS